MSKEEKLVDEKTLSFIRPPYWHEIFNKENEKAFNGLNGHIRHFIYQIIKTGDLVQAATVANVSKEIGRVIDERMLKTKPLKDAMIQAGCDTDVLAAELMAMIRKETWSKLNGRGETIEVEDPQLKLRAITVAREFLREEKEPYQPMTKSQAVIDVFQDVDPTTID